jgi:hypothetical protein
MKRIVVALIVAAVWPSGARSADTPRLPTNPQVPAPSAAQEATGVRTASAAGRVLGPLRDRMSLVHPVNEVGSPSAPAWIEPSLEAAPCAAPGSDCGGSVVAGSPIKSWLFYRPSTGHELPWLRPHPYVGPITGQFHCSPTACPACVGAPACAPGSACGRGIGVGLGVGRGCRNGDCIPPADGTFTGYKFAAPISPGVTGRAGAPTTSTSYKPGVAPTGTSTPSATRNGTVVESFKRSFSKP